MSQDKDKENSKIGDINSGVAGDAKNNIWIILVAGGAGVRFGSPKQFEKLLGKTILEWSTETAQSVSPNLVVVLPEDSPADVDVVLTTTGGKTRSASVRAGLEKIPDLQSNQIILVHDAVRPLAKEGLFNGVIQAIKDGADAAAPAIAPTDTITDGTALDRTKLLSLQTPQAFRADILKEIHIKNPESTDDISLCLQSNKKVAYIDGDRGNIKITEPIDIKIAELLKNPDIISEIYGEKCE